MTPPFQRVYSGAPWESRVGYCRALRAGDLIFVTGTAPVAEGGGVHAPGDAYAQTRRCFEIIERSLRELGADLSAVVRTRMFVTDMSMSGELSVVHGEVFGQIRPAATMVAVAGLMHPSLLVEIEVDAAR